MAVGRAIKQMPGRGGKRGMTTRAERVRRLRERLAVEQDEKVRRMIEAELRALDRSWG